MIIIINTFNFMIIIRCYINALNILLRLMTSIIIVFYMSKNKKIELSYFYTLTIIKTIHISKYICICLYVLLYYTIFNNFITIEAFNLFALRK